jgi:hemoglobin
MTTLYEKLGGEKTIQAMVDGMYDKIFSDPELSEFHRKTNR